MPAPKKPAASKPEILQVHPMSAPEEEPARRGRKPKLTPPPLPQELFDGMSDIEKQHFTFFLAAIMEEYPDLTKTDMIFLNMAGLDYINSLRLQVQQLQSGELVTMSRQHPGVQLRAWLELLSVSRKARQGSRNNQDEKLTEARAMLLHLAQ